MKCLTFGKSSVIALVSAAMILGGCERKKHKRADAPPQAPAPTEQKKPEPEKKEASNQPANQGEATKPQPQPTQQAQTPAPQQAQPQQQAGAKPDSQTLAVGVPSPAGALVPQKQSAVPVPDAEVTRLDAALPPAEPLETFGGQLIQAYLGGEMPGEQVIMNVFDDDNLVMSNLAEMSMGVHSLRDQGKFSQNDKEKVLVLEGAMTQYLNEKIERGEFLATALEYGTAAALGVVGGVYSNQIINALGRIWSSSLVQGPIRGVQSVYTWAAGTPRGISEWFSRHFGSSATAASDAGSRAMEQTIGKSTELYRRAVGFMTTPKDPEAHSMKVFNNIYRVINSPHLAKGYRVVPLPAEEITAAQAMNYTKTGIPGFAINQEVGRDYLIARQVARGGEMEYFRVNGIGIKAITKDGTETVVPPTVMTGLISSRMTQWGQNTSNLLSKAKHKIVAGGNAVGTGIKESRPYKYATVDPFGRRLAQGVAVGVPVSALTLLALKPFDTSYITLDDYARDLDTDGINIDRFIETQRKKATAGRL